LFCLYYTMGDFENVRKHCKNFEAYSGTVMGITKTASTLRECGF